MAKITEIDRWRIEITLSEKYRDSEFGKYTRDDIRGAGENIDYFEKGNTLNFQFESQSEGIIERFTTLNLFHAITKNIVPALLFQNPEINVIPNRPEDEDAAPVAREILNYYYKQTDAEEVDKKVIWDAYVLGLGICKYGYSTKFGQDVVDEAEVEKRRKRSLACD